MNDIKSSRFQEIYAIVANIPTGKVVSYGQLARLSGGAVTARQAGAAMAGAPDGLGLPCHRVVYSQGQLAPDYAFGGQEIQRELLAREGVTFLPSGRVDMARHQWTGRGEKRKTDSAHR